MTTSTADPFAALERLRHLARKAKSNDEARMIAARAAKIARQMRMMSGLGLPRDPLASAQEVDGKIKSRPHLEFLAGRVENAVKDVENGLNRMLAVSMPPRAGKSTLLSLHTPLWLLRLHPDWSIVTSSHDGTLSGAWARQVRRLIEDVPSMGVALSRDSGASTRWETIEGGGLFATSTRAGLTGRGAKVLLIDDPIKDFVDAHSATMRQNLWDWWLSVAQTRLEPPFLVIVVMTRWHEDDFVGRILSTDHEGDPEDWEKIMLPALATDNDLLGRAPGEPLLSPLLEESPEKAVQRWEDVRRSVGTYTFSAMYQQRPAPAKGAIFDSSWWRFWTTDPAKATEDKRIVHLDPSSLVAGKWLDSWDCTFKGTPTGTDWVVGQRWVRQGANRYLVAQQRGHWSFTRTISAMRWWAKPESPWGHLVHQRLVENSANGPAIIDVLREEISGIKPITASTSKEARARSITPEVESGNVYLPHPSDPGNEWVGDLLSEVRNFPYDAHDDMVDSLTQALMGLRDVGKGGLTVPGRSTTQVINDRVAAAHSSRRSVSSAPWRR